MRFRLISSLGLLLAVTLSIQGQENEAPQAAENAAQKTADADAAAAPKPDTPEKTAETEKTQPPPDPTPQIRTFLDLEAYASQLANKAYEPADHTLDPFFETLKYDDHRQIRFLKEKALFETDEGSEFRVEFTHPGWMFRKPVRAYVIENGQPNAVTCDPSLFNFGNVKVPENVPFPAGFAGWRLLTAKPGENRLEFLSFQGASYFRAVTSKLGWGLSARGVAINTIGGEPEEFPDFTHYWFIKPNPGDKTFQFFALLNGPSVTGAYHFEVHPGEQTTIQVRGSLFMRKVVKMLGLAPFSSMFWFGENTHPKALDFRPEVHDSDGLLIEQKNGPTIWRPLDNGRDMRHSVYALAETQGFGLMQRDRDFNNYQDLEANYHNRVSTWIEPQEGFGRGKLHLIELATGEETWDNVVLFWEPELLPTATEPLRFSYKMNWLKEHEHQKAKVVSSRWGEAVATMDIENDYEFVIDFTRGQIKEGTKADWVPEEYVNIIGEAKLLDKRVMFNPVTGGWRAFFKLDIPPTTKLLEMTCELLQDGAPISERWSYQWRR